MEDERRHNTVGEHNQLVDVFYIKYKRTTDCKTAFSCVIWIFMNLFSASVLVVLPSSEDNFFTFFDTFKIFFQVVGFSLANFLIRGAQHNKRKS